MGRAPWWLPWSVYGLLGALGALLSWQLRGQVLGAPPSPRLSVDGASARLLGLLLALLLTALTVLSTRWLVAHTGWARALHGTLRGALLGASPGRLVTLALLSALGEELFFRAALLPYLGLFASSLVFGALHIASRDSFLPWMLWAALMGLLFGLLFLGSGSLWAPIVAHAAINYENMRFLCSHEPTTIVRTRSSTHGERWRGL